MPPRAAIGYSFFTLFECLRLWKLIPDEVAERDAEEAITVLRSNREPWSDIERQGGEQHPFRIAESAVDSLVLIYAAHPSLRGVATRWRGQLNENAKRLCFTAFFPELNHNEVVGWEGKNELGTKLLVVLLRDADEHPRTGKRVAITRRMLEQSGGDVVEVYGTGKQRLAKMLSLVLFGDYVSLYLALLRNIDPTPVKSIDSLKSKLKEE
jgi:glucose/mannose-6-phosphate isomerase